MADDGLLVVHSTEGTSAQGAADWMRRQRTMSHQVFDPATGETIELVPWHSPARSLRNLTGGVETNRRGRVYQVEIVGRATEIPTKPDQWFRALAAYLFNVCDQTNTPVVFPRPFKPYPASYGPSNGVRFTFAEWGKAAGIVGHMHVPENSHGDPGDITRAVAILQDTTGGDPPMDTDPEVLAWQQHLITHQGADLGTSGPNGDGADGDFGQRTLDRSIAHIDAERNAKLDAQERLAAALAEVEGARRELSLAHTRIRNVEAERDDAEERLSDLLLEEPDDEENNTALIEIGRRTVTLFADASRFTEI